MTVTAVRLGGRPGLPLLVLGPSLGTSATALWAAAASHLADDFQVVGWDLPGHGHNRLALGGAAVTMAGLAADVLTVIDEVADGFGPASFHYAGNSVGGAVGLQLLLDAPDRVLSATLLCTGATLGSAESWAERADAVRASGTASMVAAATQRWFTPGFLDREPTRVSTLLASLTGTDDEGYAAVCGALAGFDVRDRLGRITTPVLAVAGARDQSTPPALLEEIATGVRDGRLVLLDDVAHLAPAEAPEEVARLVREHALGPVVPSTELTRDLQDLVAEYAWDTIWTRPGLDPRSRLLITLTALMARGQHEELALHVRTAVTHGLTVEEIKECLLQTALHCGEPEASAAFLVAQRTFHELSAEA